MSIILGHVIIQIKRINLIPVIMLYMNIVIIATKYCLKYLNHHRGAEIHLKTSTYYYNLMRSYVNATNIKMAPL